MNCAPAIIGKPNGLQKIKDKYFEEMIRISNLKRDEKYPTVFLFGPLCIASVLSFIHIGKESLWIDEAFSVKIAQLNWSELWEIVSKYEANGSLYLILLKLWLYFGDSESAIRGLSAIFAIATVPLAYALGAQLFHARAGFTAALLLSVNAFFIRYAQEARTYSLYLFLGTASTYYFVKSIESPAWKNWIGYVMSSVLAVYAHFFSAFIIFSHGISAIFLGRKYIIWRKLLLSAIFISLFLAPIGFFLLTKSGNQVDWVRPTTVKDIYYLFVNLTGDRINNWFGDVVEGRYLFLVYVIFSFFPLIIGIRSWFESGKKINTWHVIFIFSCLFVPIMCVFAISFAVKPVFVYRYLIPSIVPLVVIAGYGLSSINNRFVYTVCTLVLISLSLHSLFTSYYPKEKQDWRSATAYVINEAKSGDAILFYAWDCKVPFEIYCKKLNYPYEKNLNSIYPSPFKVDTLTPFPNPGEEFFDSIKDKHDRIWVVISGAQHSRLGRDSRYVFGPLKKTHHTQEEKGFTGIKVLLMKKI